MTLKGSRIFSYSISSSFFTVSNIVGSFLYDIDLRRGNFDGVLLPNANLSKSNLGSIKVAGGYQITSLQGASLSGANLSEANLHHAFLSGANLYEANLSDSDLSEAYLDGVQLGGANLQRANLANASLRGTHCHRANLCGADLTQTNLHGAILTDIVWDEDTKWEGVRGLEAAVNVPKALKRQLGME